MGDLSDFFYFFKEKIMFKSHYEKSNHRILMKNEVDPCGAPVFAPDYSATVLAAKMCTNSNEHSIYIIFL
jgi:hypothetical protein